MVVVVVVVVVVVTSTKVDTICASYELHVRTVVS